MKKRFGRRTVEHPSRDGFELEYCMYLIGPITLCAGVNYFLVPHAPGSIGHLIWTACEYRRWLVSH